MTHRTAQVEIAERDRFNRRAAEIKHQASDLQDETVVCDIVNQDDTLPVPMTLGMKAPVLQALGALEDRSGPISTTRPRQLKLFTKSELNAIKRRKSTKLSENLDKLVHEEVHTERFPRRSDTNRGLTA